MSENNSNHPPSTIGDLVPVSYAAGSEPSVDGRTLHTGLGSRKMFAHWIKARIRQCGLVEGQDYTVAVSSFDLPNLANQKTGRGGDRRSLEYSLSLDTAKHFCMLEKTAKGAEMRTYFIKCEKALRALLSKPPGVILPSDMDEDDRLEWEAGLVRSAQESRKSAKEAVILFHSQTDNLLVSLKSNIAKDAEIAEMKPKADGYDAFLNAEGLIGIGTLANILKVGPDILFSYLYCHWILIGESGSRQKDPYGDFAKKGYFEVRWETKEIYSKRYGRFYTRNFKVTYATPKGAEYIRQHLLLTGNPTRMMYEKRIDKKPLLPIL